MDKQSDPGTGIRKRQQIKLANKTVFAWIISASIFIGICAVVAQFFVQQLLFNNKIYSTLSTTSTTLQKNINAYNDLKKEVGNLVADENLTLLRKGDLATTNALQVIIDALPTEENRAAFATSMQREILGPSGVSLSSFGVDDTASTVSTTGASSFDCDFVIMGSYEQIQQALHNMERSIRPITIKTVSIQGTSTNMQATISATTYYQPAKDVQLKEVIVKP